jgi:hypothetical protein
MAVVHAKPIVSSVVEQDAALVGIDVNACGIVPGLSGFKGEMAHGM